MNMNEYLLFKKTLIKISSDTHFLITNQGNLHGQIKRKASFATKRIQKNSKLLWQLLAGVA